LNIEVLDSQDTARKQLSNDNFPQTKLES